MTNQVNAIKPKTNLNIQKMLKIKVLSVLNRNVINLIIIQEMKKLSALSIRVKIYNAA